MLSRAWRQLNDGAVFLHQEGYGPIKLGASGIWRFERLLFVSSFSLLDYWAHGAWPQSQPISVSSDPASSQNWLQYFSPAGGTQTRG